MGACPSPARFASPGRDGDAFRWVDASRQCTVHAGRRRCPWHWPLGARHLFCAGESLRCPCRKVVGGPVVTCPDAIATPGTRWGCDGGEGGRWGSGQVRLSCSPVDACCAPGGAVWLAYWLPPLSLADAMLPCQPPRGGGRRIDQYPCVPTRVESKMPENLEEE